jgi:phospholipid/cholesterol/gamma-HCH transport system substrate-binding protein
MRRILSTLVVIGALAAAVVLMGAKSGGGQSKTIKIYFDNAFGLTSGGDLKIGGVKAGQTTGFTVSDTFPPKAIVTAKITQPGFQSFRKDASCRIRPQSLIGEYYVDCQPGTSKQPLPNNTVPVTQTQSTIPQDLIQDIMRRPYRERLRLIINELGTGLAGRPQDLQQVIRRAAPGLQQTSRVLKILGNQNKIIQNFIVNSDTVIAQLAAKKQEVARWVVEAAKLSETTASRRQAFQAQWHKLPVFLAQLQPTMTKLGQLADQQTPLLKDLHQAAPDLNTFFTRLGPFTQASRPAFRSLGKTSVIGRKALNDSRREVDQLAALSYDAPNLAKPLRQFLQTMDDRGRSVMNDPRAAASAPPAPDPTAYHKGQGFTGFEAFWNYVYWQTLAINPFDSIGHVLRGLFIVGSPCAKYQTGAGYQTDPKVRALFDKCSSWMGPYQPGVNAPDPTGEVKSSAASKSQSKASAPNLAGRGAPEAKPKPGQPDISKPQIVLPPEVQQLLNTLKVPGTSPSLPQIPGQLPQKLQQELQSLPPSMQQQIQALPLAQQEQALQKLMSGTQSVPPAPSAPSAPPAGGGGSAPSTNTQLLNFLLGS